MSERVIGYRHSDWHRDELQRDPDAPSVQEIIRVLKNTLFGLYQHKESLLNYCPRCRERVKEIETLIAKLEE